MSHPWAVLRRQRGFTQLEIASILGIERLSVIRLEQGMFGHVNKEVLLKLAKVYDAPEGLLLQEYRGFQRETRQHFAATHNDWRLLRNYTGRKHPLIYYRTYYELSRNGLCRGLCLDYGPISEYETNRQRTIPEIIKIASEDMRWDWTALESAVLEWRASGRSSIK